MESFMIIVLLAILLLGIWLLFYILFDIGGDTNISSWVVLILLIAFLIVGIHYDTTTPSQTTEFKNIQTEQSIN